MEWIEQQLAVPRRYLTPLEIRMRCSISSRVLAILRQRGIFTASFIAHAKKFLEYDVDAFVRSLHERIEEQVQASATIRVTVVEMMKKRYSLEEKADLIEAMMNGRLKAIAKLSTANVASVAFGLGDIDALIAERVLSLDADMKLYEAARQLGLPSALPLVKSGHLTISKVTSSTIYVTVESFKRFDSTYLYAQQLLKGSHVRVATLMKVARFVDISMLSVPIIYRKSYISFVHRDAKDALLKALASLGDCEKPRPNCPKELLNFAARLKQVL